MARVLCVGLLLFTSVVQSLAAMPLELNAPLRNARTDVTAEYERLVQLEPDERRQQYRSMSPSMQEDVWIVHLERFVKSNPSMTDEQRAVIFEAVGLLSSGAIAQHRASVEVRAALSRLEYRAKTVLPPDLAHSALSGLGDAEKPRSRDSDARRLRPLAGTPECDCSADSNWCDTVTNPTPRCKTGDCTMVDGCGTFWLYICDGICSRGA